MLKKEHKVVSVVLEKRLVKEIKELATHASVSEFVRHAVNEELIKFFEERAKKSEPHDKNTVYLDGKTLKVIRRLG